MTPPAPHHPTYVGSHHNQIRAIITQQEAAAMIEAFDQPATPLHQNIPAMLGFENNTLNDDTNVEVEVDATEPQPQPEPDEPEPDDDEDEDTE